MGLLAGTTNQDEEVRTFGHRVGLQELLGPFACAPSDAYVTLNFGMAIMLRPPETLRSPFHAGLRPGASPSHNDEVLRLVSEPPTARRRMSMTR